MVCVPQYIILRGKAVRDVVLGIKTREMVKVVVLSTTRSPRGVFLCQFTEWRRNLMYKGPIVHTHTRTHIFYSTHPHTHTLTRTNVLICHLRVSTITLAPITSTRRASHLSLPYQLCLHVSTTSSVQKSPRAIHRHATLYVNLPSLFLSLTCARCCSIYQSLPPVCPRRQLSRGGGVHETRQKSP